MTIAVVAAEVIFVAAMVWLGWQVFRFVDEQGSPSAVAQARLDGLLVARPDAFMPVVDAMEGIIEAAPDADAIAVTAESTCIHDASDGQWDAPEAEWNCGPTETTEVGSFGVFASTSVRETVALQWLAESPNVIVIQVDTEDASARIAHDLGGGDLAGFVHYDGGVCAAELVEGWCSMSPPAPVGPDPDRG